MWKSSDGVNWVKASGKGFGDLDNWYVMATEVFRGSLCVGTWNMHSGCEVWASLRMPFHHQWHGHIHHNRRYHHYQHNQYHCHS